MKHLTASCTAALALLSFAALACAEPVCATLEVQNLHPNEGPLMIAGYADAAGFAAKNAPVQMQLAVTGETMRVRVCNLAGDRAAFTLFQDLNRNGKLDTNPFGFPTEPWGASGKTPAMTAPKWESSQVALTADGATAAEPVVIELSK